MPYANTYATVRTLKDTASRYIGCFTYSANTAADESDVLKVNANALSFRTMLLAFTVSTGPQSQGGDLLVPGSLLTTNGGSGATGYVVASAYPHSNVVRIALATTTPFANNDEIVDNRFGNVLEVTATGATYETPSLAIESIWYSISANTRVALQWVNANTNLIVEAFTLYGGTGYLGRNVLPARIPNDIAGSTGFLSISTKGAGVNGGYTLIVEFAKEQGFAPQAIY